MPRHALHKRVRPKHSCPQCPLTECDNATKHPERVKRRTSKTFRRKFDKLMGESVKEQNEPIEQYHGFSILLNFPPDLLDFPPEETD